MMALKLFYNFFCIQLILFYSTLFAQQNMDYNNSPNVAEMKMMFEEIYGSTPTNVSNIPEVNQPITDPTYTFDPRSGVTNQILQTTFQDPDIASTQKLNIHVEGSIRKQIQQEESPALSFSAMVDYYNGDSPMQQQTTLSLYSSVESPISTPDEFIIDNATIYDDTRGISEQDIMAYQSPATY